MSCGPHSSYLHRFLLYWGQNVHLYLHHPINHFKNQTSPKKSITKRQDFIDFSIHKFNILLVPKKRWKKQKILPRSQKMKCFEINPILYKSYKQMWTGFTFLTTEQEKEPKGLIPYQDIKLERKKKGIKCVVDWGHMYVCGRMKMKNNKWDGRQKMMNGKL